MNLTIPIMAGQIADIRIMDGKTKETFVYTANHRMIQVMRGEGNSVTMTRILVSEVGENETFCVKGVGRNKRRCSRSMRLEVK